MTDRVDEARERILLSIFATWDKRDVEDLVRLMRKFADDIKGDAPTAPTNPLARSPGAFGGDKGG